MEANLKDRLSRVNTYYQKSGGFTNAQLLQRLNEIRGQADIIILDHVHMVESGQAKDLETQKRTVALLREIALREGIPVIAISHLRKRQGGAKDRVMPDLADLHGSSELSKIATQVVLIARDWKSEPTSENLSPTLFHVIKDRRGRHTALLARINYNRAKARYETRYELGVPGWEKGKGSCWVPVAYSRIPHWAKHCETESEAGNL